MEVLQLNMFDIDPYEIYRKPKIPWNPKWCTKCLVMINYCELPPLSEMRTTPKGEKTVPELLKVGDVIKTNYGTGP